MSLFKSGIKLSVIGLAAFASFAAYAANTNITVKGKVTPEGCNVDIPGGANLDWGNISWLRLNKKNFTTLDPKEVSIIISCPEGTSTKNAIWISDADPASAQVGENFGGRSGHGDSARIFGIGTDPVTKNKIGNFVLNLKSTTVNQKTNKENFGYSNSASTHTGVPESVGTMAQWSYSRGQEWSPLDPGDSKPALGNTFTWVFDVEPQLNTADKITSSTEVPWSGTAQVNVRYF